MTTPSPTPVPAPTSKRTIEIDLPDGGAAGISQALREAIVRGSYARNERLPPERDLAEAFGVSRNTVRQALRRLEDERLIVRRTGSGTYVSFRPDASSKALMTEVSESTSPLELIEVRMTVEPKLVQLAVLNASSRDLDDIERHLVQMERAGNDAERFSVADEAFHMSIARATHNPLFVWLYSAVNDVRGHALWARMRDTVLSDVEIANYNREHRALWEAIASRNAEAGKALMRTHLDHARRALAGAEDRDG